MDRENRLLKLSATAVIYLCEDIDRIDSVQNFLEVYNDFIKRLKEYSIVTKSVYFKHKLNEFIPFNEKELKALLKIHRMKNSFHSFVLRRNLLYGIIILIKKAKTLLTSDKIENTAIYCRQIIKVLDNPALEELYTSSVKN